MSKQLSCLDEARPVGRHGERGSDVFEAAMVLPVILTIMIALFAFGRGWDIYQTMTRAAREGVRQAITTSCAMCGSSSYSTSDIQTDFVFPALQAAGINTSDATLQSTYQQGYAWLDTGDTICGAYVKFSYPYIIRLPFLKTNLTTITLNTDVQMRLENQPTDGTCP